MHLAAGGAIHQQVSEQPQRTNAPELFGKQNIAVGAMCVCVWAEMHVSVRGESYSVGYGGCISNMRKWQQAGEKRCGQTSGKDA